LRHESLLLLTETGRDFRPVLWALLAWGNKHLAPEGPSVIVVDSQTGEEAEPVLVDRKSGRPLIAPDFRSAPGSAADARTRQRHAPVVPQQASVQSPDEPVP
jgi:hypothetical protein